MSAFTVLERDGVLKSLYPRWQYLVNGYVEALGLEPIPVQRRRHQSVSWHGDRDTLPPPGESSFATGVRFDGCLYLREDDGLAWSLR